MRERIFPFDGINMPEFQRDTTHGATYLNIRNSNGERYISCNGINDLTELYANVPSSSVQYTQRLCNRIKRLPCEEILMQNLMQHFIHTSIYRNDFTRVFSYTHIVEEEMGKYNIQSANTIILWKKCLIFVKTLNITSKFFFVSQMKLYFS